MSSVTGYVLTGNDGKPYYSLAIANTELIEKLHQYLTEAAADAMGIQHYKEAEELLHSANNLSDLIIEAEAEEGSEVEE